MNANGLKYEEWAAGGFNWMKSDAFQCKYPGVTKIKGVSTCNNIKGQNWGQVTNQKFIPNETTGYNCWCKIIYPEQSKWFFQDSYEIASKHKTNDIFNEKTTTENGVVVEREAWWSEERKSKEELDLAMKQDIEFCDSVCNKWCAFAFNRDNYETYVSVFKSIGKK